MKGLISFILLLLSFPALSQFHHQYQTPDYDWARSVDVINKDGYIIAGSTLDPGVSWRPLLLRTDHKGFFQWANIYPLPGIDEHFMDVKAAEWSAARLFGAIGSADYSPGALGGTDMYYLLTNDVGAPLRARRFGTNGTDIGRHLHDYRHPFYGRGFIITGYSIDPASGTGKDIAALFVNAGGNIATSRIFRQHENQDPYWVEPTKDGGFIITGRLQQADSYEPNRDAVFLLKLNAALNLQWYRAYDLIDGITRSDDYGYAVKEVENGNLLVAGTRRKYDGSTYSYVPFLLKTDKLGNSIFVYEYDVDGHPSAEGLSLAVNVDNNGDWEYIVSGRTFNTFEALAFKTDFKGQLIWGRKYPDGASSSSANSIVKNNIGGYAMTGLYFDPYAGASYMKTPT